LYKFRPEVSRCMTNYNTLDTCCDLIYLENNVEL